MTKKFFVLMALFLLCSVLAFAQGAQGTPGNQTANGHWVPISAGFSMAIASGLCGLAQAKALAARRQHVTEVGRKTKNVSHGVRYRVE